jgi:hypothetical protein
MRYPVNISSLKKELTAGKMKAIILHYFRFQYSKMCYYIATEAGGYNADVFLLNDDESIEIEIKISKTDLRNDNKKQKHIKYKNHSTNEYSQHPNKFYFAVPFALVDEARIISEEINPKYGILCIHDGRVNIAKTAKKMHKDKPSNMTKKVIAKRMASELINLRLEHYDRQGVMFL